MNLSQEQQAVADLEVIKYKHVWECCESYGDKHHDFDLFDRLDRTARGFDYFPASGGSIIVLGCGDGTLVRHLDYLEYKTMGIDIYPHPFWGKSFDRTGERNISFTHQMFKSQSLWERLPQLQVDINWDMFVCADVLEHIPEILLNDVLFNIGRVCNSGVFQIANMKSRFGQFELHPIKEDAPWWLDRIQDVMGGSVKLVDDRGAPRSRFVIHWNEL